MLPLDAVVKSLEEAKKRVPEAIAKAKEAKEKEAKESKDLKDAKDSTPAMGAEPAPGPAPKDGKEGPR